MPSVSQTPISPSNCKKRRREDFDVQMKLARQAEPLAGEGAEDFHSDLLLTRPPYPQRFGLDARDVANDMHSERRHTLPKSRRMHEIKRQRVDIHSSPRTTDELALPRVSWGEVAGGKIDLNPCHICNRKPTEKRELEDFADCQGCGGRMCYICMRECLRSTTAAGLGSIGMTSDEDYNVLSCSFGTDVEDNKENMMGMGDGGEMESAEEICIEHRRFICSRCCVEKGEQGEVLCLGCLKAEKVG